MFIGNAIYRHLFSFDTYEFNTDFNSALVINSGNKFPHLVFILALQMIHAYQMVIKFLMFKLYYHIEFCIH